MTSDEKLNLKKLISEMDTVDNTQYIRTAKQSIPLAKNVQEIENLKRQYVNLRGEQPEKFAEICQVKCKFLFENYTDIFNKLIKDEINLSIMQQFLSVLKLIEDGRVDQHEGSVIVGKILKELYLDSAIRRGENLDKQREKEGEDQGNVKNDGKEITWTKYKGNVNF